MSELRAKAHSGRIDSTMTVRFRHEIHGALVGSLWWPAGADAWIPFALDLTRESARYLDAPTLRDLCLGALAEHGGDFQGSAKFGDCQLITTATIHKGGRVYRRQRVAELASFPSLVDLVDSDWAQQS
ncbi:MAG: hypothetical protein ACREEB_11375 [Caulobacteraceae bacterium]